MYINILSQPFHKGCPQMIAHPASPISKQTEAVMHNARCDALVIYNHESAMAIQTR